VPSLGKRKGDNHALTYSAKSKRQGLTPIDFPVDDIHQQQQQQQPFRQYYHSRSRLPMAPGAWEIDSEDEFDDDEWLDDLAEGVSKLREIIFTAPLFDILMRSLSLSCGYARLR
jgi:hypothetical protein